MGAKIYYLVEVLIFIFLGFSLYTKPEKFIKILRNETLIKILSIVAFVNAIINLFRFLEV